MPVEREEEVHVKNDAKEFHDAREEGDDDNSKGIAITHPTIKSFKRADPRKTGVNPNCIENL